MKTSTVLALGATVAVLGALYTARNMKKTVANLRQRVRTELADIIAFGSQEIKRAAVRIGPEIAGEMAAGLIEPPTKIVEAISKIPEERAQIWDDWKKYFSEWDGDYLDPIYHN